ncbi:MAG: MaoC/PaaZ C-terminal domain-containing protein [Desulfotignum sp.]|nr:MaoC/PaaZ C-terminal domain-containing protein [Desulfotignum sp.]
MSTDIQPIPLTEDIHTIHMAHLPLMPAMFCRLLISAIGKQTRLSGPGRVAKVRLRLKKVTLDPEQIDRYRRVCGYAHAPDHPFVPSAFIQTLFIGLLGRYITSDFFPINPLGLIQTDQQFESRYPVQMGDSLDLSCTLHDMTWTDKGISTRFHLEASQDGHPVWQGISTYLTRTSGQRSTAKKMIQDPPLPIRMTIRIPSGTGRNYARISGDYNPHHLSDITARIIGFKQAMVHGMWSLARTLAGLETFTTVPPLFSLDVSFKLPVFMPATLNVGCKQVILGNGLHQIFFDLRDTFTRRPHLKGRITHRKKES